MKLGRVIFFAVALHATAAEIALITAVPPDPARGMTRGADQFQKPLIEGKGTAKKDRSEVTESDRQWWAFQPLKRVEPPKVNATRSVRTPIDNFLLARLEATKLKPNPPADRPTLFRRASFDLLGLPPAPGEVEAFVRDNSPDAWPKVVAALLDSPRYGERWARHWLDVARFAESSGFEHDTDRPNAYHYRDFVIKALNADLPYDQFVRWQLAGDEFDPDNALALMATGFLGAGVFPTQITANEVERTRMDTDGEGLVPNARFTRQVSVAGLCRPREGGAGLQHGVFRTAGSCCAGGRRSAPSRVLWLMGSLHEFKIAHQGQEPRASVLDCGPAAGHGPVSLSDAPSPSKSARGLAQSKTSRKLERLMGSRRAD